MSGTHEAVRFSVRLQSAIGNLKSNIRSGGIAQLVERQLCKLEVRGSNPLASSLRSRRREERRLSRRSLGEGGRLFSLLHFSRELRLGKPVDKTFCKTIGSVIRTR